MPMGDNSTQSTSPTEVKGKQLIKIVCHNKQEENFLESVKTGFRNEYEKINDPALYKTFDEVFEIKNVSMVEFKSSPDNGPKYLACFYTDAPSRLEDLSYEEIKKKTQGKTKAIVHILFTSFAPDVFQSQRNNKTNTPYRPINQLKGSYSLFEVQNEERGELKIVELGTMITNIKEEKTAKAKTIISWKQTGLLVISITGVALCAYLMMRNKKLNLAASSPNITTDKNSILNTAANMLPSEANINF